MQVLLFDVVTEEVNRYINKAKDETIIDIASKVYNLDWEYFKYRNIVRIEGADTSKYNATKKFYKLYGDSTPDQIVGIYNYIHNTNYEVDTVCNILREKKKDEVVA